MRPDQGGAEEPCVLGVCWESAGGGGRAAGFLYRLPFYPPGFPEDSSRGETRLSSSKDTPTLPVCVTKKESVWAEQV